MATSNHRPYQPFAAVNKWQRMDPHDAGPFYKIARNATNTTSHSKRRYPELNRFYILHRHGCPQTIISDNGTQLKSQQLAKTLATFGIEHGTTLVHVAHCNPVERTNRVVKTMVVQYVGRNHQKWDQHLPALKFANNTAVQESTGYSPAYLICG